VKLVVIYGAPGVGKLTTGRALAELTGFTLFHNHLTFNLVHAIFPFGSPPFWELTATIKLATFEAAARAGVPGLVFTFVYAAPEDDEFVGRMIETLERHGAEPLFVRLSCDTATHEARVAAGGRREMGKMSSVDDLRGALRRWNLTAPIARRPTLEIDNSTLSAEAVARRIAEHFALPTERSAAEGGHRS
jgi:hypothetical protein